LGELDVPIYQKEGRFFIDRAVYRAPLRLTCDEVLALLLAANMAARSHAFHSESLRSAVARLSEIVPQSALMQSFQTAAQPADDQNELARLFDMLMKAWVERRHVLLSYRGKRSGQVHRIEFAVYALEPLTTGAVYVVGLDRSAARVRILNLSSIVEAQIGKQLYEIPADFDSLPYIKRLQARRHADGITASRTTGDQGGV
jgi:predicted DNA-binding transcriptional regulator YafY